MQPEGGYMNFIMKRRSIIVFRIIWLVLTSTFWFDSSQGLMMESEGGHKNSVLEYHDSIEFGIVWFVLSSTLSLDGISRFIMGGQ